MARPPNTPSGGLNARRLRLLTEIAANIGRQCAESAVLEIALMRDAPHREIRRFLKDYRERCAATAMLPIEATAPADARLKKLVTGVTLKAFDAHFGALVAAIHRSAA